MQKLFYHLAVTMLILAVSLVCIACSNKKEAKKNETTKEEETETLPPSTFGEIVVISENIKRIEPGTVMEFAVKDGNETLDASWSISGHSSQKTYITSKGVLVIDKDEEAKSIIVNAISNEDVSLTSYYKVAITYPEPETTTTTAEETTTKETTTTTEEETTTTKEEIITTEEYYEPSNEGYTEYIPETTPAHVHSYSASTVYPTCTEGGYTVYTCSCGASYTDNYTSALGHDWSSWTKQEATCTSAGVIAYQCNRCSSYYEESTGTISHNYVSEVIAPGPWTEGYTIHTCTMCGTSYTDSYTEPTGGGGTEGCNHNWVISNDGGNISVYCTICGATQ
jgi:hypothetical protein